MAQELKVMTVEDVRAYVDKNNVAWLNAEDVARGLGFVKAEEKVSPTSGRKIYTTIRWERVNGYLAEFGFPNKLGKDDFIPENMFYRLAMKASNAAAQKFQAKVADVILPSIRKHGVYATQDFLELSISNPDYVIGLLTKLKHQQEESALLKVQLAEAKPKINYCDSILRCPNLVTTSVIAKDYGMSAKTFNALLHEFGIQFKQGDIWLLYQKYAAQGWTQTRTYPYIDANGLERCKVHTYWTQKGRLELYHLLKSKEISPLIERDI